MGYYPSKEADADSSIQVLAFRKNLTCSTSLPARLSKRLIPLTRQITLRPTYVALNTNHEIRRPLWLRIRVYVAHPSYIRSLTADIRYALRTFRVAACWSRRLQRTTCRSRKNCLPVEQEWGERHCITASLGRNGKIRQDTRARACLQRGNEDNDEDTPEVKTTVISSVFNNANCKIFLGSTVGSYNTVPFTLTRCVGDGRVCASYMRANDRAAYTRVRVKRRTELLKREPFSAR